MRFAGRRVFVTGATGFIGGVVARKLLEEGAQVTCLVRPATSAGDLERRGARIVRGDVTDPTTLDLADQELLVHAAAWVGYGLPAKKRPKLHQTNVGGTRNLLAAAEKAKVAKVVHVSSIAALETRTDRAVTEDDIKKGDAFESDYARTKTESHGLALGSTLPIAIPMPGLVVGRDGPFDPLFRALARGRLPALPGDDAVKGWVHVEDCAEAILQCALKGTGPYVLVDENMRATELLVAACEEAALRVPRFRVATSLVVGGASVVERTYNLFGKTPPVSRELLHALKTPMTYDSTRARRELGWRPRLVERLANDLRAYA